MKFSTVIGTHSLHAVGSLASPDFGIVLGDVPDIYFNESD